MNKPIKHLSLALAASGLALAAIPAAAADFGIPGHRAAAAQRRDRRQALRPRRRGQPL